MLYLSANAPPFGDNTKKAWEPYLLLVLQTEALELPIGVNEQRRSLTQNMCNTLTADAHASAVGGIYISTKASTVAAILTPIEIFQISVCQERASSKRFQNVCWPSRVALDRASAMRSVTANLEIISEMSNRLDSECVKIRHGTRLFRYRNAFHVKISR